MAALVLKMIFVALDVATVVGLVVFNVPTTLLDCISVVGLDCLADASVKSRKATDAELFRAVLIEDIGSLNRIHAKAFYRNSIKERLL
jgi:hypothetical protein